MAAIQRPKKMDFRNSTSSFGLHESQNVIFRTYAEPAQRYKNTTEVLHKFAKGTLLGGSNRTNCLNEEIEQLIINRHEGTRERYQQAYDAFRSFCVHSGEESLQHNIQSYLTSLLVNKGLAPPTIRQQWAGIKALLSEEGIIVPTQMETEIKKLLAGINNKKREKKRHHPN